MILQYKLHYISTIRNNVIHMILIFLSQLVGITFMHIYECRYIYMFVYIALDFDDLVIS